MRALFMGDTASMAVLGFSPWVIPLIAVAAKSTFDHARNACWGDVPQNPPCDKKNAESENRPRGQEAPHDRLKAKRASSA
jgi:hypothetical protein